MKEIPNDGIFDLILTFISDACKDDIDKRVERILLPALQSINQSKEILKKNYIKKLQNSLDISSLIH